MYESYVAPYIQVYMYGEAYIACVPSLSLLLLFQETLYALR